MEQLPVGVVQYTRKNLQEHREHFAQRLMERYGLTITLAEYKYLSQIFQPIFKKRGHSTIGFVMMGDTKVWCLMNNTMQCVSTCYPPGIEDEPTELMRACFPTSVMTVANLVYDTYLREDELLPKNFETIKDAAIWYFNNTLFPTLHIEKFKHGKTPSFKIMFQIRRVLDGDSDFITLRVVRKNNV